MSSPILNIRTMALLAVVVSVTACGSATFAQDPYALPPLSSDSWSQPLIRPLPELVLPGPVFPEEVPPGIVQESDEVILIQTDEPPPKVWDGNFEIGLSGSEGSSQTFNFRLGGELERTWDTATTTWNFDYKKNSAQSVDTANRLFTEARHVWPIDDSAWNVYLHGTTEFDDFQPFDSRIASDAGLGYQFWETDAGEFKGRVGAGTSREIGGPMDRWVPEASLGLEFKHQLTKKQKLSASADVFPSWENFSAYRLTLRADWEVVLDEETNLSLKVGVIDRYDSTSSGGEPNQLDYSTVLLWSF